MAECLPTSSSAGQGSGSGQGGGSARVGERQLLALLYRVEGQENKRLKRTQVYGDSVSPEVRWKLTKIKPFAELLPLCVVGVGRKLINCS